MAQSVAAQRQTRAVKLLLKAVCLVLLPLLLPLVLDALPVDFRSGALAMVAKYLPLLCWLGALLLFWQAWQLWQSSNTKRGTGPLIPAELRPLQNQRWQLDSSAIGGDGQIVAQSPKGRTYCILFKGDRGRLGTDGRQVFRLYDQTPQPFPVNFVEQAKQRAARTQQRLKQIKAKPVVPVLVFTAAIVELDRNPIGGVWVLPADGLRRWLLQQEMQP